MLIYTDLQSLRLIGGVFAVLSVASVAGYVLGRRADAPHVSERTRATVANLNARLRAWWVIISVCAAALLLGKNGACVLFGLASFAAWREFLALTPARGADRVTLTWVGTAVVVLQYVLVAFPRGGLFQVFIPVGALLLVPVGMAMGGECGGFLERAARLQWGLLVCVYGVSHAPALLSLPVRGQGARLLLFFLLVVQSSDVLQYLWGKACGRHPIAPRVSPNKTWEGFVGGVGSATVLGAALWRITPFTPWQAAGMSLAITLCGFAGGLVMSAVKRDRGIKDFGTLIRGHGGVLDRLDSVCFAAPVFYHLTRYWFT